MIHPFTCLRYVNGQVGYGVYSTSPIPKGTIVYVRDPLDVIISPQAYIELNECYRKLAEKYSFIDEKGNRVMSWDWAKFVNHCCDCNTISTGYGFEIAIRDIDASQEITDEYGLFNLEQEMQCCCGSDNCRGVVRSSDVDYHHEQWDLLVQDSLRLVRQVRQPLWPFMDNDTEKALCDYLDSKVDYTSVLNLKYVAAEPLTVPVVAIPEKSQQVSSLVGRVA